MLSFFSRPSYLKGVFFSLCACLMSVSNDLMVKFSGLQLQGSNILFFRFAFGTLCLLPWFFYRPQSFRPKHFWIHVFRGGGFTLAMLPWCYGLIQLSLPTITLISFTTPLFVVVFSYFFLREKLNFSRIFATCLGFLGIFFSLGGNLEKNGWFIFLALLATSLFAFLDVVNKKLMTQEEEIPVLMLFSSLWSTIFSLPLALMSWQTPHLKSLMALLGLGIGSNVLFWFLLKAGQSYDLSALQPLRYSEFIFSALASIIFFSQWPESRLLLGMAFIIPASIYITRKEIRREKENFASKVI